MIIYNSLNGEIIANVPDEQDVQMFVTYYPEEIRNNVSSVSILNVPENLQDYKIIDKKIVRRTEIEIRELSRYGRILTEEERQLNKLRPSPEEVRKAENTIEILTLIQEVI